MFKGRKGQSAIPLLVFYLIMNVLTYILISTFVIDDVIIGSASSNNLLIDNTSTNDDISVIEAISWFESFKNVIFGIPWWAVTIWIFLDVILLVVIGLAFIRGV